MLSRITADWSSCTACRLHERRTQVVAPGDCRDDPTRPVVLVVCGPADMVDDAAGRPITSSDRLSRVLAYAGVLPNCVVVNCVACRPPGDRSAQEDEIAACRPRLTAIVAATSPVAIVSVGRLAREQTAIAFPHARKKDLLSGIPRTHVSDPASWPAGESVEVVEKRIRAAAGSIGRLVEKIDLAPRGVEGTHEHRWKGAGWWTRDGKPVRPIEQCPCGTIR